MAPTPTFWMRQRQVKLEEAGPESLKLVAPNLPAYELRLRKAADDWVAELVKSGEHAEKVAERPTGFADPDRAWQAAFELYRQQVIA